MKDEFCTADDRSSGFSELHDETRTMAANVSRDVFGTEAVTAAARCALVARNEGRDSDYRFWLAVFNDLRGEEAQKVDLSFTMNQAGLTAQ
jgi:hypothetical protein